MLELTFRPDRDGAEPLYRQLATYLRDLIEADRLSPGTKLPATRELGSALGLARVTIVAAYEALAREGRITSHVGRGSFVAARAAVGLVARVPVGPADTVVIEQPGYFGAALAFRAAQANLVGVGVDAEGLRTGELARVLRARRVKLVYATPAAQSPTGVVMSEARRRELLALADEHQTPILEDDYAAELRYRGPAVSALKSLDRAGQVIYAGTF